MMRGIFGVISLVIVLLVVGVLVRKQLGAMSAAPVLAPPALPDMATPDKEERIQQQFKHSVEAAMQQPQPLPDDLK